jgi:hypothetical protein
MCQLRGKINTLRNSEKAIPGRPMRRLCKRKITKLMRNWLPRWEVKSVSRHKRKTNFYGTKYSGSFKVEKRKLALCK